MQENIPETHIVQAIYKLSSLSYSYSIPNDSSSVSFFFEFFLCITHQVVEGTQGWSVSWNPIVDGRGCYSPETTQDFGMEWNE